jgi:hypothetical protein
LKTAACSRPDLRPKADKPPPGTQKQARPHIP